MKIKRFFAKDIRQAIKQVKEDLGADAVILSNKNVDGGVEIVAARDYDEQQIQASLQRQKPQPPAAPRRERLTDSTVNHSRAANQNARRYQAPKVEQKNSSPRRAVKPEIEWSQEPALVEMKKELSEIRKVIDIHLSQAEWASSAQINPVRIELLKRLRDVGISKELSMESVSQAGGEDSVEDAYSRVQGRLANQLPVSDDRLLDQGGVIALVGPTGVGKTTTIAKLAARFRMKHGPEQVALVSTDHYRIGAHEQLTTYARILGVPVRSASSPEELDDILNSFLDRKLVLIDTAGLGQRDDRIAQQQTLFEACHAQITSYLVLSATTQTRGIEEAIRAFSGFNPRYSILTKIDEACSLGAAVSALISSQLGLAWVTDGQQVPEDLHRAHANRLINQCFSLYKSDYNSEDDLNYEAWVAQANV